MYNSNDTTQEPCLAEVSIPCRFIAFMHRRRWEIQKLEKMKKCLELWKDCGKCFVHD